MFVYLVQHAEALSEKQDPSRALSEKGLRDINRVALYLSGIGIPVDRIFHSPKLRAEQTANILGELLKPPEGVSVSDGLLPLDAPSIWAEKLNDMKERIMLVGHLPHLSALASLLLCRDAGRDIIAFRMAGTVCLRKDENGLFSLRWMITPDLVL